MNFCDHEQGSEGWFKDRLWKVTASEVHKIFTPGGKYSEKQSAGYIRKLILENYHPIHMESKQFMGNDDTDRGHEFEGVAADWIANQNPDVDIRTAPFITSSKFSGLLGFSADRLIYEDESTPKDDPFAGLEIKCPTPENHYEYLQGGCLPPKYKPQVHASMIASGLDRWHFLSYNSYIQLEEGNYGLPHFHVVVERDDYTDQLEENLGDFFNYYEQSVASIRDYKLPKISK